MSEKNSTESNCKRALLVIDMQNDFCPPAGSLAVNEGDRLPPIINALRVQKIFDLVVFTQDFHPPNHCSFYENNRQNPNAKLFEELELPDVGLQMMWPVHCVQGSNGAQFLEQMDIRENDIIVQKGLDFRVDSYSGFFDNKRLRETQLNSILKQNGITEVYLCGLATDFCVGYSALDAVSLNFKTYLITDATRGVAPHSTTAMLERLQASGVVFITSESLLSYNSAIPTSGVAPSKANNSGSSSHSHVDVCCSVL